MNESSEVEDGRVLDPLAAWPDGEVWFREYLDKDRAPWLDENLFSPVPVEAAGQYGLRMNERTRVDGATYEAGEIVVVESRRDLLRLASNLPKVGEWIFPWYGRAVPDVLLNPHQHRISLADYRREFTNRFWSALLKTLALGAVAYYLGEGGMIFLVVAVMWGLHPLVEAGMALTRRPDRLAVSELNSRLVNFECFRRWIAARKSLPLLIGVIVIVLLFVGQTLVGLDRTIQGAALVRAEVMDQGEWWRLVTTGLLHGSFLHLLFNATALYSLGRILAALLSASFIALVFLLSVVIGSLASLWLSPGEASVGASGGILGCLGFLLVTTWKFRGTIPGFLETNLIQSILVLTIFGLVGSKFIDNAAHAGGLITGVALGLLMYPALKLAPRRISIPVRLGSVLSLAVLAAGVAWIGWIFWQLGFP